MYKRVFSILPAMRRLLFGFFCLILLLFTLVPDVHAAGLLYAKSSASGTGDCSTWANACSLQTALAQADSGDEIWVAAGVHYPGTLREDSFTMESGVAVYGGFAGTETLLSQRDWFTNPTVLSGDIDGNDTNKDANGIVTSVSGIVGANAYHVLVGIGADQTAVFDGFIINAGQADGTTFFHNQGGGVYLSLGNPTLTNLVISANKTNYYGAGLFNDRSAASLSNIAFRGNTTTAVANNGGGMFNHEASPTLSNVLFSGNHAYTAGGFFTDGGDPSLINVTFSGNSADNFGGAVMYTGGGNPTLVNTILWGNQGPFAGMNPTVTYSIIQGGFSGVGNLDVDPLFVDPQLWNSAPTSAGDYRLRYGAPAIDVGNNAAVTLVNDLDGNPRLVDGNLDASTLVDLGAYERQVYTLTLNVEGSGNVIISPVQITYGYLEQVTLTANADTGWTFAGWSGDVVSTDNPLILTINGNTTITARFVEEIFMICLPLIIR